MLRHLTSKFLPYSFFFRRNFKRVTNVCEICKKELKKDKESEEYLDVDNADSEEFSNKWNLPRNLP